MRGHKIHLDEKTIERLHFLRSQGMSWEQIGASMGLPRSTITVLAKKLGMKTEKILPTPEPPAAHGGFARAPLPPGHPSSWGAISTEPFQTFSPYKRQ